MNPYYIEIFVKILGLGATSGLFYQQDEIKLIADNSNYFYAYTISDSTLHKTMLHDNLHNNEIVEKKNKFDLESIFKYQDSFYLLGSGSSNLAIRNKLFIVDKDNNIQTKDCSTQFAFIRKQLEIHENDFNIEGAFMYNEKYHLLNRGNGPKNQNGIIISDLSLQEKPFFVPLDLSKISPHLSITDGTVVDDYLYFLAAIEHSNSTYTDGEIGGSYVGYINLKTFELENILPLSETNKFEGITLYQNTDNVLEFLLCEDTDLESQETIIYKLTFEK
ncbi:DUF6929 family protein [Sphingobacterium bovistauri]|uniref:Uncharacterized protein n=1 Tax=Sphingobacterium bovistauri TaxID=2781959 RepID=A0ABS7Z6X4_9SPHI|nr:hypothetical protein [Sphingobacterium bovistauri]MCA5005357.1 hypothetical protein [Sphingobacterium bovistauri]